MKNIHYQPELLASGSDNSGPETDGAIIPFPSFIHSIKNWFFSSKNSLKAYKKKESLKYSAKVKEIPS